MRVWTPRTDPQTRLVLLRHGATAATGTRYSGRGDEPLSPDGEAQIRAAAQRLAVREPRPEVVVSSPLPRAEASARIVAEYLGLPVTVDPDLVECDFGVWEGRTFSEVSEGWPEEQRAWSASSSVAPPGGECFDDVAVRVRRALMRLRAAYPARCVVVLTHVTPIKMVLRDALGGGQEFLYRLHLDAAGMSVVDSWPDGGVSVRVVNDTAHLERPDAATYH